MGIRIAIFILLLPLFSTAQTTDVKDVQVARQKLQIGTDAAKYLNEIVQTISAASTHVQSPTAKAVYDYLTGFLTTVNLTFTGTSSPVTLANSGGTDVTFTAGSGISLSASSGNITITNTSTDQTVTITGSTGISISGTYPNFTLSVSDQSATNEAQTLSVSGTSTGIISLNAISGVGGGTATIAGAGINTVSQLSGTITVTGTEVDGALANEGVIGVGAGGANTAVITSNTSGATGVTISGGTGITVTESTSSNGGTITITNSSTGITGSLTSPRIPFASGSSTLTDDATFTWDNTNKRLLIGTGTSAAFLNIFAGSLSGTQEFIRASANVNGNMMTQLLNANNVSSSANAINTKSVGGASAGDPFDQYIISGVRTWSMGVDNSDSDRFKISSDATLGASTTTDLLVIDPTDRRTSVGGAALQAAVNLTVAGTGSITVPSGTTAQRPGNTFTNIRYNTDVTGMEFSTPTGNWFRAQSAQAPGIAAQAGAGTGASATLLTGSNDIDGMVNIVMGTTPASGGVLARITFGDAFSASNRVFVILRGANDAAQSLEILPASVSNSLFDIKMKTGVTAATPATYQISYHVSN